MHSIDPAQLLTQPGEPTPATLRAPIARLLLATRLPFLTITLFGALLGIAGAWSDGVPLNLVGAAATLLLALITHAAVNVLNDWCDHHNGTDAINTDRIYPFTGGSRMIQNGVFTAVAMRNFAIALFGIAIGGGLLLTPVAWRRKRRAQGAASTAAIRCGCGSRTSGGRPSAPISTP